MLWIYSASCGGAEPMAYAQSAPASFIIIVVQMVRSIYYVKHIFRTTTQWILNIRTVEDVIPR